MPEVTTLTFREQPLTWKQKTSTLDDPITQGTLKKLQQTQVL